MKTLKDFSFDNKRVLVRVDFNVPIKNGKVTDDTRLIESLATIKFLLEKNCTLILCSHLGRPKGKVVNDMSLKPVAEKLSEILQKKIFFAKDCIGEKPKKILSDLQVRDILLLENLRFHSEEEKNEENFSRELASLADCFVNDAFGSSHRAHSSVVGVTKFLPSFAGLLLEKEIKNLTKIKDHSEKPFLIILGGAKVSDKLGVIKNLLTKANSIIIAGGMSFTFLAAKGYLVGKSILEEDKIESAKDILQNAYQKSVNILLPKDVVIADNVEDVNTLVVSATEIPVNKMGLDIGPKTIAEFIREINKVKTIFWNGPVGMFEKEQFSEGTKKITQAIAASFAYKVCGGGDTIAAISQFADKKNFNFISTGGGASLEFLEGKILPGIAALEV